VHVPDEPEEDSDEESFGPLNKNEVNELAALPFQKDSSPANGSSIAILIEFEGRRVLLTGDAHADVLEETLLRLSDIEQGRAVEVDAFKVSHHGSRKTLSPELVRLVNCHSYLISTDGSRHHHPDREAIARIVRLGSHNKTIIFNYRTDENKVWDDNDLKNEFFYSTRYPDTASNGEIRVELL
jgi:beta-lactamase superfamily II metal-dependent hydrolase